jgi:hypothetical protein
MAAPPKALLVFSALLLLLAGCATQSPPGQADVLPAGVFRLKGDARWRSNDYQPWQVVKVGTRIHPGETILIITCVVSRLESRSGRADEHRT